MKIIYAFLWSLTCVQLYACNSNIEINEVNNAENKDTMKLKITVSPYVFHATLENNATTAAFKSLLPITVNMIELNANEKYADLPQGLPTNSSNPGTIHAGDLMLYGSSTLVLFYKTFSTSYHYTRLGKVDDVAGLAAAVGSGNVSIRFELAK